MQNFILLWVYNFLIYWSLGLLVHTTVEARPTSTQIHSKTTILSPTTTGFASSRGTSTNEGVGVIPSSARTVLTAWPSPIVLTVGDSTTLDVTPQSQIYIQKRILNPKTIGSRLVLTATHHGQTLVKIDEQSHLIFVLTEEDRTSFLALQNTFSNHPTIRIHFNNEGLLIRGEALSAFDFENIFTWRDSFPFGLPVVLQVTCPEFLTAEVSVLFSQRLKQAVTLPVGPIESLKLKAQPNKEARAWLKQFDLKFTYDEVDIQPMGRLKIYFAEVKRNKLEQISPILNSTHPLKPLALEQLLTSEYKHTDEHLFSSVGSQTEILLFDQQTAKIHSGGEFPILNQSFHRSDVSWKQFGLFLDVIGKDLDETSSILDLNFKLSMVVSSSNESSIPSLTSDSWVQKIRILKNHTYILKSGFTKHHLHGQQGSSIFKHIPLLKFLFQGRSKNTGDSDLVLVLTLTDTPL